jgi:hypothetical protein
MQLLEDAGTCYTLINFHQQDAGMNADMRAYMAAIQYKGRLCIRAGCVLGQEREGCV